jgi:plasmid stabilization system protein ParE
VGQQVRDRLADDPVDRATLRLKVAEQYLKVAAGAGEERREEMADAAEEKIEDAREALKDRSGPQVAAVLARAIQLEARVEDLEHQKDADDRSGPGGDTEPGDDRSGPGGDRSGSDDDDPAGDDNSGPGGGGDRGGSGSSGSGSGSGSGRSGSDDG